MGKARKLFIAGNWKMNHHVAATTAMLQELKAKVADVQEVDVAVCPPFTSLAAAVAALAGSNVAVGAQNCHWAKDGAFTGEISAAMLAELKVVYVVLGHSERRQFFGETDTRVNLRTRAVLAAGLRPIVCLGETLAERKEGNMPAVIASQVAGSLAGLTPAQMELVTIAYEPVWAIGTGETATPAQAQEVHAMIRKQLAATFGAVAERVRIQYGGSVKASNVKELMSQPDLDGALVGGASLKAADFSDLLHHAR